MSHFYTQEGEPCYQVPNVSKGGMRDTTIRDAKKLNLVKSVTTVLDVPDKPALARWKINQVFLTLQRYEELDREWTNCIFDDTSKIDPEHLEEMEEAYKIMLLPYDERWKAVLYKSEQIGRDSAAKGHALHDDLEKYYKTGFINPKTREFIQPVIDFMSERFAGVEWISEESFTSRKHQFGGRVDMYSKQGIILDFKTKATDDIKKMQAYETHHMQTAAYAVGLMENNKFDRSKLDDLLLASDTDSLRKVERYDLFISTEKPGLLNLTQSEHFDRDWDMFRALNIYWKLKNWD